jgi:hypothetical protein
MIIKSEIDRISPWCKKTVGEQGSSRSYESKEPEQLIGSAHLARQTMVGIQYYIDVIPAYPDADKLRPESRTR